MEGQVPEDGLLAVVEGQVFHRDGAAELFRIHTSFGPGIVGADGDLFKIGLGGREGKQALRPTPQPVGETAAQVAAARQRALEDHALDGQDADQNVDQHLTEDVDAADSRADKTFYIGQAELRLLDLVAGRFRSLAEPLLPAKGAQYVPARQKVL